MGAGGLLRGADGKPGAGRRAAVAAVGCAARWILRALRQPSRAHRYTARLQHTQWGELYERLRFQEQRLREVEAFMRDLAMGRTPVPITPTDAADPLARSSQWLLRRLEREQSPHEQAS